MAVTLRDRQRAGTEAAILDAAWRHVALTGPDGTSVREIAADAGCNHALVTRYFGSKDGLVGAVADLLEQRVDAATKTALAASGDPVLALLTAARGCRPCVQLIVRGGLGDLGPGRSHATHHVIDLLEAELDAASQASARPGKNDDLRQRLCTYGAASLILGWLTYENFVAAATGLGRVGDRRRDLAIAATVQRLLQVANEPGPSLAGPLDVDASLLGPVLISTSARDALVAAAVELYAERGPASVSVREVAQRAGVNQGLIYRHLGSKQALISAAFEQGSSDFFPAALAPDGFAIDTVIHQVHRGYSAPMLIARILADDVDITDVRDQFPILRRLLIAYDGVPRGAGAPGPTDPRIAVASVTCMALGSSIYGRDLRAALGLPDDRSVESAIADLCRVVLAEPFG